MGLAGLGDTAMILAGLGLDLDLALGLGLAFATGAGALTGALGFGLAAIFLGAGAGALATGFAAAGAAAPFGLGPLISSTIRGGFARIISLSFKFSPSNLMRAFEPFAVGTRVT